MYGRTNQYTADGDERDAREERPSPGAVGAIARVLHIGVAVAEQEDRHAALRRVGAPGRVAFGVRGEERSEGDEQQQHHERDRGGVSRLRDVRTPAAWLRLGPRRWAR